MTEMVDDNLSASDFEKLSALIGRNTGISLAPAKRMMVEGRIRRRVQSLGMGTLHGYCRFLFDQGGLDAELQYLIDAITTNKTDFFRENEHFRLLEERLVPNLLALPGRPARPLLKIWSAASSTGAEAFTIAMVLAEMQRRSQDFRFAILGTDISSRVLDQAERAVYSQDMTVAVPGPLQARYLMRSQRRQGASEARIVPELRQFVRFSQLNLMDKSYPIDRELDVIFLRNLLIYFERDDQIAVIRRMIGHLRPGGYLILGLSDLIVERIGEIRQIAPSVFEKL